MALDPEIGGEPSSRRQIPDEHVPLGIARHDPLLLAGYSQRGNARRVVGNRVGTQGHWPEAFEPRPVLSLQMRLEGCGERQMGLVHEQAMQLAREQPGVVQAPPRAVLASFEESLGKGCGLSNARESWIFCSLTGAGGRKSRPRSLGERRRLSFNQW